MDCTKHNAADRPTASMLLERLRKLSHYEYVIDQWFQTHHATSSA